jgi:hypothetical protein
VALLRRLNQALVFVYRSAPVPGSASSASSNTVDFYRHAFGQDTAAPEDSPLLLLSIGSKPDQEPAQEADLDLRLLSEKNREFSEFTSLARTSRRSTINF